MSHEIIEIPEHKRFNVFVAGKPSGLYTYYAMLFLRHGEPDPPYAVITGKYKAYDSSPVIEAIDHHIKEILPKEKDYPEQIIELRIFSDAMYSIKHFEHEEIGVRLNATKPTRFFEIWDKMKEHNLEIKRDIHFHFLHYISNKRVREIMHEKINFEKDLEMSKQ